jgi:CheY-like chemotaxis protein
VVKKAITIGLSILLLVIVLRPALAQESGQFYKTPTTTAEFWRAMKHEIELGQYKMAAAYLKGFLAKKPTDEELLQIQEREGNSVFLRLLAIPELRADAKPLIERVDAVVQQHLSDQKRLDKLIRNLNATPEERNYAIDQLRRAGAVAMPALIDALIRTSKDADEHSAILSALPKLGRAITPPLLASLDVNDPVLRGELVDVLGQMAETGATPDLWYPSGSSKQPASVRGKASALLTRFLGSSLDQLPPAKAALTQAAERYYQHKVAFGDPQAITVWRWDGKELVSQAVTPSQAEEYFGLRFARQALDLDPTYQPAQIVFLSIALEKGFERAGLDQPLSKGAPAVKDLLTSVNPELVTLVLERALREHRLAVILGATRALGELAEVRAARPSSQEAPALVRALNYPDRRVQLAAADSLLRIPGSAAAGASARVVDILRRAVGTDSVAKILIGDANADRANRLASAVKQAGFFPVIAHTGREGMQRLTQAADIDALWIDATLPDPQLAYLLAELRADADVGRLPVIVAAAPDRVESLRRSTQRYSNVWVTQATEGAETLKLTLSSRITEASGKALSEAERNDHAAKAIEWLARLGRGEVPGYDIRPAEDAILKALRVKELASLAVEAAGRLPGRSAQRELANLVLDDGAAEAVRSAAAVELCRHIQQNGLALNAEQVKGLEGLFGTVADAKLKANVALVMGSLRPDARITGQRLQRYTPALSAPVKPAVPEEQPKEKKADSGL